MRGLKLLLLAAAALATAAAQGAWQSTRSQDLITDEDTSFISVTATQNPASFVQGEARVTCDAASPLGVRFTLELGRWLPKDETLVTTRVDTFEPRQAVWRLMPGSEAVAAPWGELQALLSQLEVGSTLVVRVEAFDGEAWDYVLPVEGFGVAVRSLACAAGF